jgi:hypothetical protein
MENKYFDDINQFEAIVSGLSDAEIRALHPGRVVESEDGKINPDLSKKNHADEVPLKDRVGVFNKQTQELAAIVSSKYKKIDHSDVFLKIADALKSLGIQVKGNIRLMNGGNVVVIKAVFEEKEFSIENDSAYYSGFYAINSYDSSRSFKILPYHERQVCSNGLVIEEMLEVGKISRRHLGDFPLKEKIVDWIEQMISSSDELKARLQAATMYSVKRPEEFLEELGIPETKVETVAEKIERAFPEDEKKATLKSIYDGLTYWITHEVEGDLSLSSEIGYHRKAERILKMADKVSDAEIPEEFEVTAE